MNTWGGAAQGRQGARALHVHVRPPGQARPGLVRPDRLPLDHGRLEGQDARGHRGRAGRRRGGPDPDRHPGRRAGRRATDGPRRRPEEPADPHLELPDRGVLQDRAGTERRDADPEDGHGGIRPARQRGGRRDPGGAGGRRQRRAWPAVALSTTASGTTSSPRPTARQAPSRSTSTASEDASGPALGADVSLASDADLYVGGTPQGHDLDGAIDFLRIARGTLADAKTTIEELYAWEFDGPFLYDFTGRKPVPADGGAAGAIDDAAAKPLPSATRNPAPPGS